MERRTAMPFVCAMSEREVSRCQASVMVHGGLPETDIVLVEVRIVGRIGGGLGTVARALKVYSGSGGDGCGMSSVSGSGRLDGS